jgi:hypothetical protein
VQVGDRLSMAEQRDSELAKRSQRVLQDAQVKSSGGYIYILYMWWWVVNGGGGVDGVECGGSDNKTHNSNSKK